jgi:hypothetical protein
MDTVLLHSVGEAMMELILRERADVNRQLTELRHENAKLRAQLIRLGRRFDESHPKGVKRHAA